MEISLQRLVLSARVERQSEECTYISTKLMSGSSAIDPTKVPSVSPVCVQAANKLLAAGDSAGAAVTQGICIAQCQTLHDLIESCFGNNSAHFHFALYCGTVNGTNCLTVRNGMTYTQLDSVVSSNCGPANATSCNSSCTSALRDIKQYSGCCGLTNEKIYAACNITAQAPCTNSFFAGGGARELATMTVQLFTTFIILLTL